MLGFLGETPELKILDCWVILRSAPKHANLKIYRALLLPIKFLQLGSCELPLKPYLQEVTSLPDSDLFFYLKQKSSQSHF
jgi:hypothetical protein